MDPSKLDVSLSLDRVQEILADSTLGNCVPVFVQLPADLLTPTIAYLRAASHSKYSFLLESVLAGENIARYSFIGMDPFKVLKTGPGQHIHGDPMTALEKEFSSIKYIKQAEVPTFTGGAIGYVSYDCIKYFEPSTAAFTRYDHPVGKGVPEAVLMLCDTIIVFDHIFQNIKVVSHVFSPDAGRDASKTIAASYQSAIDRARSVATTLLATTAPPLPLQLPIPPPSSRSTPSSAPGAGHDGYTSYVRTLKQHIVAGDIIQAVPSHRLTKRTAVHPFNVYRRLRQVNPSPYMFYLDCGDGVRIVGASPETLCKVEKGRVFNHAIAGTVRRGKTAEEDDKLAAQLLASPKDRAEHIMLVDLARNDVNRVCQPLTVKVDHLMRVEKFSHVIHLTSQVGGMLRSDKTRFDAFRSIFPAGTVSGAPKIKAIQLVAGLERQPRGVYAGAVGRWDFSGDEMDTCIAIRTMTFLSDSDGAESEVWFQAGGGIVHDSEEEEEWIETINKLSANVRAVEQAEDYHYELQQRDVAGLI